MILFKRRKPLITHQEFLDRVAQEKTSASKRNCISTALFISGQIDSADQEFTPLSRRNLLGYSLKNLALEETSNVQALYIGLLVEDWCYDEPPPKWLMHLGVIDPYNPNWCYHRLHFEGPFEKIVRSSFIEAKSMYENSNPARKQGLFSVRAVYLQPR